jgi:signal transduction histidine kinase
MKKRFILILIAVLLVAFGFQTTANTGRFSILNLKHAVEIEQRLEDYPEKIKINLLIRLAQWYTDTLPDKSAELYNRTISTIQLTNQEKYNKELIYCHLTLGNIYFEQGSTYLAEDAFLNTLTYANNRLKPEIFYNIYSKLGKCLYLQKNYSESIRYFKNAMHYGKEYQNKKHLQETSFDIAKSFLMMNEIDSTEKYIHIVIEKYDDKHVLPLTNLIHGEIEIKRQNYSRAIPFFESAIDNAIKLDSDNQVLFMGYTNLAYIYAEMGKYETAGEFLNSANNIRNKLKLNEEVALKFLQTSGYVYQVQGELAEANKYYKEFIGITDSIIKLKQNLANLNFKKQIEILQKDKEIQKLQFSNKLHLTTAKKNRIIVWVIVGVALLIFTGIFILIKYQREKNRDMKIIADQQAELALKQHKEELNKAEVKAALAQLQGQELERERLSKELHDGVAGSIAGLKMEIESISGKSVKTVKHDYLVNSLQRIYQEVRDISRNLSLPNFEHDKLRNNILNMINNFPGKSNLSLSFSGYPIENWDDIDIKIQKELYRIIQEAITNVIKHSQATELDIQFVNDGQTLTLTIEDDGIGFDINKNHKGIGLRNIISRTELVKGNVQIDSAENQGTSISITIPLNA